MLSALGLVKRYGQIRALDGFDLTVAPGEITGLVGHNGAGKTTFVEVVTRLIRPDSGQLFIGGIDALRNPRGVRRLIGVSPQEPALYISATVRENLQLFGSLAGLRRSTLNRAVEQVTEELGLTETLDRPVGLLSGGQFRRTQAATALVWTPPLLLLDEPTAGADPETRAALLGAVRSRAEDGAAVVYTTHYLPELTELGASLAIARRGRIVARGNSKELLSGLPGTLQVSADAPLSELVLPTEMDHRTRIVEGDMYVTSHNPSADLAVLLQCGCRPASVDIRRPDLDDLYHSLAVEAANDA
jgi:ABC-2 type transport system ATP-binding protein